jgi:hypothetical protein
MEPPQDVFRIIGVYDKNGKGSRENTELKMIKTLKNHI